MTTKRPDDRQAPEQSAEPPRVWTPPELIEYGSFRKLTQSKKGSAGESGNFSMKD
jgi:hypothetical protein